MKRIGTVPILFLLVILFVPYYNIAADEQKMVNVLVLDFANKTGDSSLDWLEIGLARDISWNIDKLVNSNMENREEAIDFLKRKHFTAIPPLGEKRLSLLMNRFNLEYTITGIIDKDNEKIKISCYVHGKEREKIFEILVSDIKELIKTFPENILKIAEYCGFKPAEKEIELIKEYATNSEETLKVFSKAYKIGIREMKPKEALALVEEQLLKDDSNERLKMAQVSFLLLVGNIEKALNILENLKKKDHWSYNVMSVIYYSKGDFKKAKEFSVFSIEQKPSVDVYKNIAVNSMKMQKFEDAILFANKALKIAPSSPKALSLLGTVYYGMGNMEEGIKFFKKAYSVESESEYLLMQAQGYESLKEYQKAIELLETITEVEEKDTINNDILSNSYFILAKCYESLGNKEKSRINFEEYTKVKTAPQQKMGHVKGTISMSPPAESKPIAPWKIDFPKETRKVAIKCEKIPYKYLMTVSLKVNGVTVKFMVDTGASITTIDSEIAKKIKLENKEVSGATGTEGMSRTIHGTVDLISVEGIEIKKPLVSVISLPGFFRDIGIEGLLGCDFFKAAVCEINYKEGILVLHNPEDFDYRGKGIVLPFKKEYDNYKIEAVLNNKNSDFMFDSGWEAFASVASNEIKDFQLDDKPKYQRTTGGIGGVGKTVAYHHCTLELGKEKLSNINIDIKDIQDIKDNANIRVLGSLLLEEFKVILDTPRQRLIFEKYEETEESRLNYEKARELLTETLIGINKGKTRKIVVPEQNAPYRNSFIRTFLDLYFTGQQWQKLIDLCDELIQQNQNDISAYSYRGLAQCYLGKLKEAIEDYKEVLKMKSDNSYARKMLGWIYLTNGNSKAEEELKLALQYNPFDLEAHYYLAILYVRDEDYKKAINELKELLRKGPMWKERLKQDPALNVLQGEEEFLELLGE